MGGHLAAVTSFNLPPATGKDGWAKEKPKKTYRWSGGAAFPFEEDARAKLVRRGQRQAARHVYYVCLGVAVSVMGWGEHIMKRGGEGWK